MDGDEVNSFTDFLNALEGREGSPSRESFAYAWQALRAALVHELKKRGLWNSPPRFLGIYGATTWWQAQGGGLRPRDALDELVAECYTQVFVQRLRSLRAHRKAKGNVDGLVFLAIRHFVHDRQKANDPEGYRVFDLVQLALRRLLDQGILSIAGPGPAPGERAANRALDSATILTFLPQEAPPLAARDAFRALVQVWNNDLLPGIVNARYREKRQVQEKLVRRIARLPAEGILAFRLKDLLVPLKDDTRRRWRALAVSSQGEVATGEDSADGLPRIVLKSAADVRFEERDSFEKLTAGVAREIRQRPELDERTRTYLRRLWQGLGSAAVGEGPDGCGSGLDNGRPSQRELASVLGIPRDRLPDLLDTLRRLTREYQTAAGGLLAVDRSAEDRS